MSGIFAKRKVSTIGELNRTNKEKLNEIRSFFSVELTHLII